MYGLPQLVGVSARLFKGPAAWSAPLALFVSLASLSPAFADEDKCDILKNAHVSLEEVVEKVLDKYDGLPVKAELEEEDGMYYYEIDLVSEGGRSKVFVNPANGLEIGFHSESGVAVRFQRFWESKLAAILTANISLLDAIETAQAAVSGFVSEVELKSRREPYVFEIVLLDDEIETEVTVDAKQGRIIEVDTDD